MFKGMHCMRVYLTYLVLHLASACLNFNCFDLMGFFTFSVFIFRIANKMKERIRAGYDLYPLCCGVAEILKSSGSNLDLGNFSPVAG